MNVRNKIVAFAMSFIICFGTVSTSFCNDKKYLASNNINPIVLDGGVISAPMVATISTLAVASGIALISDDDIYDIACLFYEKYKDNWEQVNLVFDTCVSIGANKVVTVGKEFLELVKACFDDVFLNASGNIGIKSNLSYMDGVSLVLTDDLFVSSWSPGEYKEFYVNDNYGYYCQVYGYGRNLAIGLLSNVGGSWVREGETIIFASAFGISNGLFAKGSTVDFIIKNSMLCLVLNDKVFEWKPIDYEFELPYTPGSYAPGGVLDGSDGLGIYVPSKPSSLVGANPSDVVLGGNPSYEYGGTITLPNVSNPSLDTSLEGTFNPSLDSDIPSDVPSEKPGDIVFPPMGGGLDFTPITQSSFTDKFPFSLAKDIKNIISVFDVEPKAPKFTVPIVSEELEIDLTQFNIWASIIRFFVLIGFMIALINITRKVIG